MYKVLNRIRNIMSDVMLAVLLCAFVIEFRQGVLSWIFLFYFLADSFLLMRIEKEKEKVPPEEWITPPYKVIAKWIAGLFKKKDNTEE